MTVDLNALPKFYETGLGVFGYCITREPPSYIRKASVRPSTWQVFGIPKRAMRRRRGRTFIEFGTGKMQPPNPA